MFPTTKIGTIAKVKGGKRLPKGKIVQDEVSPHPYLRVVDFREDGLDISNIKYIDEESYSKISRYTISSGDIYISIAGTIGRVGIIPDDLSGSNLTENAAKICELDPSLDKRFLMYFLRSPFGQSEIASKIVGTSQPKLALFRIEEISIPNPPIETQRKIASVLSTYDELVENNTRRIKILEEMAQRIYREWFVHFRLPGHEKVKMVESELGMIPEGWEVKVVSDAVHINPKTIVKKDIEKYYIPMSGVCTDSMLITEFETRTGNNGSKFKNDDTLMARITPCLEHGKTAFVQFLNDEDTAIGSTEFIVMRSRTLNPYFVYFLARNEDLRNHAIKSMTGASGRQRVRMECFDTFSFIHPDENILNEFATIIAPIFKTVHLLWKKNQNLRQTRDLLLPKLISGKIKLKTLI